jgi:RNA polymerase primary sigma factor
MVTRLNRINAAERLLHHELGRKPRSSEIATYVDLTSAEADQIRRAAQNPVSLAKPIGADGEGEFGDMLADDQLPQPDETVEALASQQTLKAMLALLPPRSHRVLELRFGLNGEQPLSLAEVGGIFNVTRERIRQIEAHALKQLRNQGPRAL